MGGISAKCDPLGAHPQRTIEMATRNGDQKLMRFTTSDSKIVWTKVSP